MSSSIDSNTRFKTLLTIGNVISVVGWIVVGLGCLFFIGGLGECGRGGILSSGFGAMGSLTGLLVAVSGLFLVAQGKVISCFVSIENNTSKSVKLLRDLIERFGEKPDVKLRDVE